NFLRCRSMPIITWSSVFVILSASSGITVIARFISVLSLSRTGFCFRFFLNRNALTFTLFPLLLFSAHSIYRQIDFTDNLWPFKFRSFCCYMFSFLFLRLIEFYFGNQFHFFFRRCRRLFGSFGFFLHFFFFHPLRLCCFLCSNLSSFLPACGFFLFIS